MQRRFLLRGGLALALSACSIAPHAADAPSAVPGPKDRLERAVDVIMVLLANPTLDEEAKWQSIAAIVFDRFDFEMMSRSIMAGAWGRVGVEERLDFVEYFSRYVIEVYRRRIEGQSAQRVEYLAQRIDGSRATVDTLIVTDRVQVPVSYRLAQSDGDWRVYDVLIEGVSLVNTYRERFAPSLQRDGVGKVIEELKEKQGR